MLSGSKFGPSSYQTFLDPPLLSILSLNINFLSHNCFAFSQFFAHVEEAEWAAEVLKSTDKPSAITLCIGPHGDRKNVSAGECAVRLARAGTVKQFSVDGTGLFMRGLFLVTQ